ncbi:uncharacterized protein TNCV_3413661 [Trichonephila clavipes]|uniref:RNase H type-1 domain-containing protein n=1 Tax=Trichonephila clavipes TaxID=2585209 RepID=A0A8X6V5L5_TRICX|nr:uncharacterized protein TNCV_3413661 [Trichonephila clavipes]
MILRAAKKYIPRGRLKNRKLYLSSISPLLQPLLEERKRRFENRDTGRNNHKVSDKVPYRFVTTGLRNTCPRDIILFEADRQPLSFRRRACLTKYYNKLRSLDSRNHTSAYFKDWCNNQKLRRNSSFSQMVSFNFTVGAVEPHHLSQCLDPAYDLDGVFFHPESPVHVNKHADLLAYLKQLALERIGDIPVDDVQVYTDGSRDDNYRSGSGIYIKSQDHILRIQRKNPDGCSVFHSELIAIHEAILLHFFQMEKRFGYCLIVQVQYSTCPIGKV